MEKSLNNNGEDPMGDWMKRSDKETIQFIVLAILMIYGFVAFLDPIKYPIFHSPQDGLFGLVLLIVSAYYLFRK